MPNQSVSEYSPARAGKSSSTRSFSNLSGLSKALERDRAWLELEDRPAERTCIEEELLDSSEKEALPISKTAYTRFIEKSNKGLIRPNSSLILTLLDRRNVLPVVAGGSLLMALSGLLCFQLHSLHANCLQSAVSRLKAGSDYLSTNNSRAAISAFDKALALVPSAEGYTLRARAYIQLKQFDAAYEDCKRALKLNSNNADASLMCAKICSSRREFTTAIKYFRQYLSQSKDAINDPEIMLALGRAQLAAGQYSNALESLNHVLALRTTDIDARLAIATCLQRLGRQKEAITVCTQALKLDPKSYNALVIRGASYQKLREKRKAMADFDRAIVLLPGVSTAYVARGLCFARSKLFSKAFDDFDKASETNPADLSVYSARATTHLINHNLSGAGREYSKLLAVRGFTPDAHFYFEYADFLANSGQYNAAIETLQKAQRLDPSHAYMYALKLADCYAGLKKFSCAVAQCEKALATRPGDSSATAKHGQYSNLAGNRITGTSDLFKAIELDPSNAEAYVLRANFFIDEKKYFSALEDLQRALRLDPDSDAVVEQMQYCKSQLKQPQNNVNGVKASCSALSKTELHDIAAAGVKSLQEKAYVALKNGKKCFALSALTRAIQLEPNNSINRRYMAFALASSGSGSEAIQQLYAWERLTDVSANDEIALANVLAQTDQGEKAKFVFEHVVQKFSSDGQALTKVAASCSSLGYDSTALFAIGTGLQVASESDKTELLRIKSAIDRTDRAVRLPRATPRTMYKG